MYIQPKCIPEDGLHLSTIELAKKDYYYGFMQYGYEYCNMCKGTLQEVGLEKFWVIQFSEKGNYTITNNTT